MEDAMAEVFSWGHDPKGVKGKLCLSRVELTKEVGWVLQSEGASCSDWAFSLPWRYNSEEAQPSCLQRTHYLPGETDAETVKLSMVR